MVLKIIGPTVIKWYSSFCDLKKKNLLTRCGDNSWPIFLLGEHFPGPGTIKHFLINLIDGLISLIGGLFSLIGGLISLIGGLISLIGDLISPIGGLFSLFDGLISQISAHWAKMEHFNTATQCAVV